MTLPFFKRGFGSLTLPDDRLGRLRKLLDRAEIQYHRDEPEAALRRLPFSSGPLRTPRRQVQKFRFPLAMPSRVAMFEGGFSADGAIRQFASREVADLYDYVPEALVFSLQLALTLADQKQRRLLDLPTLTAGVVVLTSVGDTPLGEHHRTLIWRAFGVPIFEQLQGWDGTVIARECEVHDGLHIEEAAVYLEKDGDEFVATQLTQMDVPILRVRTGLTGSLVTEHCECGAETPRLRDLASVRPRARAAVA